MNVNNHKNKKLNKNTIRLNFTKLAHLPLDIQTSTSLCNSEQDLQNISMIISSLEKKRDGQKQYKSDEFLPEGLYECNIALLKKLKKRIQRNENKNLRKTEQWTPLRKTKTNIEAEQQKICLKESQTDDFMLQKIILGESEVLNRKKLQSQHIKANKSLKNINYNKSITSEAPAKFCKIKVRKLCDSRKGIKNQSLQLNQQNLLNKGNILSSLDNRDNCSQKIILELQKELETLKDTCKELSASKTQLLGSIAQLQEKFGNVMLHQKHNDKLKICRCLDLTIQQQNIGEPQQIAKEPINKHYQNLHIQSQFMIISLQNSIDSLQDRYMELNKRYQRQKVQKKSRWQEL